MVKKLVRLQNLRLLLSSSSRSALKSGLSIKYFSYMTSALPRPMDLCNTVPHEAKASRRTSADTFFVASAHAERGVDASHRGGLPGFVRVLGDRTLEIPDYPGNSMFNTLGNPAADPRAGRSSSTSPVDGRCR